MGTLDGPAGRPVQCAGGDHEGGLGRPVGLGCGLGECPPTGVQDGPGLRRPGDSGLKLGDGVSVPGNGAGLECCGREPGWLLGWFAACRSGGVRAAPVCRGLELGGAGAATVTCASC
ncbi:MAG TPA: hypothetical protein VKU77_28495 [Streptosporangiaceae bacterium]|nr:hypothetical protein [Streptosporangiaceae bacterium]